MASPQQLLRKTEIVEMAERLRKALGRRLTVEEQEFFLLAEQAYAADETARISRPKAA